jgi:hypothetical protein
MSFYEVGHELSNVRNTGTKAAFPVWAEDNKVKIAEVLNAALSKVPTGMKKGMSIESMSRMLYQSMADEFPDELYFDTDSWCMMWRPSKRYLLSKGILKAPKPVIFCIKTKQGAISHLYGKNFDLLTEPTAIPISKSNSEYGISAERKPRFEWLMVVQSQIHNPDGGCKAPFSFAIASRNTVQIFSEGTMGGKPGSTAIPLNKWSFQYDRVFSRESTMVDQDYQNRLYRNKLKELTRALLAAPTMADARIIRRGM